jgi:hypothetical protein
LGDLGCHKPQETGEDEETDYDEKTDEETDEDDDEETEIAVQARLDEFWLSINNTIDPGYSDALDSRGIEILEIIKPHIPETRDYLKSVKNSLFETREELKRHTSETRYMLRELKNFAGVEKRVFENRGALDKQLCKTREALDNLGCFEYSHELDGAFAYPNLQKQMCETREALESQVCETKEAMDKLKRRDGFLKPLAETRKELEKILAQTREATHDLNKFGKNTKCLVFETRKKLQKQLDRLNAMGQLPGLEKQIIETRKSLERQLRETNEAPDKLKLPEPPREAKHELKKNGKNNRYSPY